MTTLRIGYVPLSDAAVLIAAVERGFAAAAGLNVVLVREASWASIRDKLVFGHFDAAHMLAPLAVATTLGLGHIAMPLAAPFALNLGGNAVTISRALAEALQSRGRLDGTLANAAAALRAVADERDAAGQAPLTFATVFPFSTHTYLLRRLLGAAGLDPDRDARVVVIPPAFMVEALRRGHVDGFCVGSPWNSVAVEQGVGTILLLGNEIVRRAPEKVLAIPAERSDADHVTPLLQALAAAADWCAMPEHRDDLAGLLGRRRHLDLPAALIRRTLDGALAIDRGGTIRHDPEFLMLGGAGVNRPDLAQADWLFACMRAAGQIGEDAQDAVRAVYRPDIYDAAKNVPKY
jgi:NitT/TauT family transport system ATP-binding protein